MKRHGSCLASYYPPEPGKVIRGHEIKKPMMKCGLSGLGLGSACFRSVFFRKERGIEHKALFQQLNLKK